MILDYLAEKGGKFGPKSEDERREILRWILFDNHKFTSYAATLRFMLTFMKTGETPVTEFLRTRVNGAYGVLDRHLASRDFAVGGRPTIATCRFAAICSSATSSASTLFIREYRQMARPHQGAARLEASV